VHACCVTRVSFFLLLPAAAAAAQALGVSRLGAKLAPEWPLAQQLLFALGMLDTKYR
jgi:hypothetical protein